MKLRQSISIWAFEKVRKSEQKQRVNAILYYQILDRELLEVGKSAER